MTTILAASIVRNARRFIRPVVASLAWVDTHVIVDDHSTDGTGALIDELLATNPRLRLMPPWFSGPMLPSTENTRDLSMEQHIRNRFLDMLYEDYQHDALVLVDADELMHSSLRQLIERSLGEGQFDGIALETNHLVSKEARLRVFEQCWNGVKMVDPHVRILFEKRSYHPGAWADVPDCFIQPTERTRCSSGPYHFHLKYLEWLRERNLAFPHLPAHLPSVSVSTSIEPLPARLPTEVEQLIDTYLAS